jgi:hypothetical protein
VHDTSIITEYSFILALQDNTHVLLDYRYEDSKGGRLERIPLSKGDVLMFPGTQLHAGDAYSIVNARIHWYSQPLEASQKQIFITGDQPVEAR